MGIRLEKIHTTTPPAIDEGFPTNASKNIHPMYGSVKTILIMETIIVGRGFRILSINNEHTNRAKEIKSEIEAVRYKSKGSIVASTENGWKTKQIHEYRRYTTKIRKITKRGPAMNAKIPENALKSHALNGCFSSLTARYLIFIQINHSAAGRPRQRQ